MKLTRNRNTDREIQRGSTCFKCTFCRQNLTLNSSHFLQIVKSDNWSGATGGNRHRDQNWLPKGHEGVREREGGWFGCKVKASGIKHRHPGQSFPHPFSISRSFPQHLRPKVKNKAPACPYISPVRTKPVPGQAEASLVRTGNQHRSHVLHLTFSGDAHSTLGSGTSTKVFIINRHTPSWPRD